MFPDLPYTVSMQMDVGVVLERLDCLICFGLITTCFQIDNAILQVICRRRCSLVKFVSNVVLI
jgi:hypothetical protein